MITVARPIAHYRRRFTAGAGGRLPIRASGSPRARMARPIYRCARDARRSMISLAFDIGFRYVELAIFMLMAHLSHRQLLR